ncbi:hypothetical protein SCLCIDRAFT_20447 [Scleroderma citrinum Foug A]|uniref:Uncharacterized protein n=1 Tax=Scleroderma citrinum Foug A TaxID=1036808 RepID=A0A0C3E6W9_9AGAM|nr:hypothetical protein SCLCIDRAFT_20447 [Scleroderma citrinum Foug A]
MLCADCKSRKASSVVIDVVPRLPLHPAFEGLQMDRIAITCLRCNLDTATALLTPNVSVAMFRGILGWLRSPDAFEGPMTFKQCFESVWSGCVAWARPQFEFDSSVWTLTPSVSVQTICGSDEWPRRCCSAASTRIESTLPLLVVPSTPPSPAFSLSTFATIGSSPQSAHLHSRIVQRQSFNLGPRSGHSTAWAS